MPASAHASAVERGAEPVEIAAAPMELKLAAVRGIGGALIYFIDRYASLAEPDCPVDLRR